MPTPHRNPRSGTHFWVVLLLSILVFALIDGLDLFSQLNPGQEWPHVQRLDSIQLWLSILFWPLVPLGLFLIYFGIRILRTGRFPPPNSRLITRTSVETGRQASIRGAIAIIGGVSLCVLAIYGAVVIPGELTDLSSG